MHIHVNNEKKKKKLEDIIEKLDKTNQSSDIWKRIISENKEEFQALKKQIRSKQNELKELVINKQVGGLTQEDFDVKLKKLQDELSELEFEIYKLRLK